VHEERAASSAEGAREATWDDAVSLTTPKPQRSGSQLGRLKTSWLPDDPAGQYLAGSAVGLLVLGLLILILAVLFRP